MQIPLSDPQNLCLDFSGIPVSISSTCANALQMIRVFYGHFETASPINQVACYRIEEVVDNGATCLAVTRNGSLLSAPADPDEFYQSMKELIFHEATKTLSPGSWLLHCAAGQNDEGTILLPGFSGSGKTTLLMALIVRGLKCSADDMVPVDIRTGLTRPFPTAINLREPGRTLFFPDEVLAPFVRRTEVMKSSKMPQTLYIDLHKRAVATIDRKSVIRWIVIPRRQKGLKAEARNISNSDALKALLLNCYNSRAHIGSSLDVLVGIIKKAKCYELLGDNPYDMAECIEHIMHS